MAAPRTGSAYAAVIAGLGPVLVLDMPVREGSDAACCCDWLSRACEAQRLRLRVVLTPELLHEELVALDADEQPRVRVVRLPESDYHGWEHAGAALNAQVEEERTVVPIAASSGGAMTPLPPIVRRAGPNLHWRARMGRFVQRDPHEAALTLQPLSRCTLPSWRVCQALAARELLELP